MGVDFLITADIITKRYLIKCVYCEKAFYSGDIVNHTIKCSEIPRCGEYLFNQQLTDILLHFLGFKKHLLIDFANDEIVQVITSLYYFFFDIRKSRNIKQSLKYLELDRFSYVLLSCLSEEISSYDIPIYPNIIENHMPLHFQEDSRDYFKKTSDDKLNSAYKDPNIIKEINHGLYPRYDPQNILTYQDGSFRNI